MSFKLKTSFSFLSPTWLNIVFWGASHVFIYFHVYMYSKEIHSIICNHSLCALASWRLNSCLLTTEWVFTPFTLPAFSHHLRTKHNHRTTTNSGKAIDISYLKAKTTKHSGVQKAGAARFDTLPTQSLFYRKLLI